MRIIVNGKTIDLECPISIAELLAAKNLEAALVAVEYNDQWLQRDQWPLRVLQENDKLEIVRVVGGG
ncbi:MAG: sulfur carrier protein ThiS [Anaerolineae bacterium]